MSIQTDLTRIKNAKAAIKAAIEGKGVTVPDATLLDGMAALIESIEAGGGDISSIFDRQTITGTFTLASDSTSYIMIDIGQTLDKLPSLYFLFCDDTVGDTHATGHRAFYAFITSETSYLTYGHYVSNGNVFNLAWGSTSRITKSAILAPFSSKYIGLSGQTFRWIVFV